MVEKLEKLTDKYPILNYILDLFTIILIAIIIGILFIIPFFIEYILKAGKYEYVDINNNRGYAEICYYGNAQLTCRTNDGKIITVLEFKKVD